MAVHYKLSSQWTVYRHRDGGVLPRRLHGFGHRRFPRHCRLQQLRPPRHRAQRHSPHLRPEGRAGRDRSKRRRVQGSSTRHSGCGTRGITLPGRWQMSVEAAVKMPLDGARPLLSTGRTDYGMQVSVRRLGERNALHMDFSGGVLRRRRHAVAARVPDHPDDRDRLGAAD